MENFPKLEKCWLVSWPDPEYGTFGEYVWAETRGKAKAWANASEYTDYVDWTDLRVSQKPWGDLTVNNHRELIDINNNYADTDEFIHLALEHGETISIDEGLSVQYFDKEDLPMIKYYGGYSALIGMLVNGRTRDSLQEDYDEQRQH